jgi:hypothetical protein
MKDGGPCAQHLAHLAFTKTEGAPDGTRNDRSYHSSSYGNTRSRERLIHEGFYPHPRERRGRTGRNEPAHDRDRQRCYFEDRSRYSVLGAPYIAARFSPENALYDLPLDAKTLLSLHDDTTWSEPLRDGHDTLCAIFRQSTEEATIRGLELADVWQMIGAQEGQATTDADSELRSISTLLANKIRQAFAQA